MHLGRERHCESEVSGARAQHIVPGRIRTRTYRSRVERTNHEATMPSTELRRGYVICYLFSASMLCHLQTAAYI